MEQINIPQFLVNADDLTVAQHSSATAHDKSHCSVQLTNSHLRDHINIQAQTYFLLRPSGCAKK